MGKSYVIRKWKDQIMSELSQDDKIIEALGLNPDENPDDLVWKRFMPHLFVPYTESDVRTYICVEINIPERRARYGSNEIDVWVHPVIVFYVLTHQEDMHMQLAGESGTRMDYLSELIEEKYEGRNGFGVGVLQLKSDLARSIDNTYRVRELIFEAVDLDDSLCEGVIPFA